MAYSQIEDGIVVVIAQDELERPVKTMYYKLLFTDSGHYRLPTDDFSGIMKDQELLRTMTVDYYDAFIPGLSSKPSQKIVPPVFATTFTDLRAESRVKDSHTR